MSPLNAAICTTISYTLWVEWYYIKNNYLTLRSKVLVPRRSLQYTTHRLMVMHPHTKYHWPISRQKCYGPDKKTLFKKQLFDLEVKDQGPTKVITVRDTPTYGHAHTNYLPMNSFVGFVWIIWPWGQSPMQVITVRDTPPYGHAPTYQLSLTSKDKNVMARTWKYYLKNNYLTLRSKVKVPQRSLWYATHRLMVMHPHTNYH
jgi:hypothetical protein